MNVEDEAKESYAVYIEALHLAINALPIPQGREYQQLLTRIYDGFKNQNAQMGDFIRRINEMHQYESRTKDKQLAELTEQFDQYRKINDLDAYFAKNLSKESRERVLENIKSLM